MNADDIEEGDDVYFECKVNANPVAYKVVWKHNVSFSLVLHLQIHPELYFPTHPSTQALLV
jgi:hypothetical protein